MLVPATRYADCEAALAFITGVLGFDEHAVYRDDAGNIVHAQIRLGQGIMMFGPPGDGAFDGLMTDPARAGGVTTSIYAVVDDVTARHAHAVKAGARIVMPLEEQSYGGASFSVRDPEGHIWTLGDYDPREAS